MKDYLIRAMDKTGRIRVFAANTTNMVEEARKTHNSAPTSTAAMGRSLTAAAMMGVMMKNPDDMLTLHIKGNGPIGNIVMVANQNGKVKGYVDNPAADVPSRSDNKLDVAGVVGNSGYLSVTMDLGLKEPYVGQSNLVSGEIAEDIAMYYATSEQQPSAVALGVLVDKDISVKAAGGLIIQLLPGVSDEDITLIENSLANMKPISTYIDKGMTPEEIVEEVLGEFEMEVIAKQELKFECDCSKDRVKTALTSVGKEEIQAMIDEDQGAEVVCHFCNTKYNFTEEELKNIIVDK